MAIEQPAGDVNAQDAAPTVALLAQILAELRALNANVVEPGERLAGR